ncbi:hypothetical protein PanWU01x14_313400 [Parasponia andersonii]|uniref:Uncharacterized protein n=1 Tax=Parasponia andersonii TaxID=3476 RepID=A0A2P5APA2_PARAD|nr:hypothetical protein PanWU01x14_313400 [Parasponia andersonii]
MTEPFNEGTSYTSFGLELGSGELETLMDRILEDFKQFENSTIEKETELVEKKEDQQAMPELNEGTSSTTFDLELGSREPVLKAWINQIVEEMERLRNSTVEKETKLAEKRELNLERLDKLEKLLESKYASKKRNKSEVSAALTKSLNIVDIAASPVKRPKPSTKKPPADAPTQPRPNNDSEIMADTTPVQRNKPAGRRQKGRSNPAQK